MQQAVATCCCGVKVCYSRLSFLSHRNHIVAAHKTTAASSSSLRGGFKWLQEQNRFALAHTLVRTGLDGTENSGRTLGVRMVFFT